METKCPVCETIRVPEKTACDCGFRFTEKRKELTPAEADAAKGRALLYAISPLAGLASSKDPSVAKLGRTMMWMIVVLLLALGLAFVLAIKFG